MIVGKFSSIRQIFDCINTRQLKIRYVDTVTRTHVQIMSRFSLREDSNKTNGLTRQAVTNLTDLKLSSVKDYVRHADVDSFGNIANMRLVIRAGENLMNLHSLRPVDLTQQTASHSCDSSEIKTANSIEKGFTLMEVMIVVAIIGIIAAIGYPQYGSYITKTKRSDGQIALMQEVQALERCKSTSYSYESCTLSSTTSSEDYYTISLEKTSNTYKLTATGKGSQAKDTDCKVMTLNHQGVRTPDPATKGCWKN